MEQGDAGIAKLSKEEIAEGRLKRRHQRALNRDTLRDLRSRPQRGKYGILGEHVTTLELSDMLGIAAREGDTRLVSALHELRKLRSMRDDYGAVVRAARALTSTGGYECNQRMALTGVAATLSESGSSALAVLANAITSVALTRAVRGQLHEKSVYKNADLLSRVGLAHPALDEHTQRLKDSPDACKALLEQWIETRDAITAEIERGGAHGVINRAAVQSLYERNARIRHMLRRAGRVIIWNAHEEQYSLSLC